MNEKSQQRVDADNAFLRMQNRSSVQARIMSETEEADMARDANTARLKALRLEKAALELASPATKPGKR
ncbi:hypothetical protein [Bosea sp. (in: a-proteobacteria)]|jgi:hypothetical protein|uniref:hypothetical protein n=1 Tax=Bosea sp. (in: a-proteobacteria) TaxID=1871050 RepID=UPI0025B7F2B6|nr:hypothetical protein [Bosea sp. (in: a-proteobacteria)]